MYPVPKLSRRYGNSITHPQLLVHVSPPPPPLSSARLHHPRLTPPLAQVDTRVFRHLVRQEFPPVAAHLEGLGADISCVFVQWFLCLFVNFLPDETCLRVWDVVFYQRSSVVLFQVCPYPQTAVSKP